MALHGRSDPVKETWCDVGDVTSCGDDVAVMRRDVV